LKNLNESVEYSIPTYNRVFKFDISCENIKRMISFMIERDTENAKGIHIKETSLRSK